MPDLGFPDLPRPPFARPTPIEIVVPRQPLVSICEALSISIHDVVNSPRHKRTAFELYKVTCRIENESWLRRRLDEIEDVAWIDAHL